MEISTERIIQDLVHLSSTEFEGRLSGTKGAEKTATFLASSLHSIGITPFGENGYFSPVPVQASRLSSPVRLRQGDRELRHRIDFAEWSPYTSGGTVSGQLLTVRDGDDVEVENLANKIVLIPERPNDFDLRGTIEFAASNRVAALIIESGEPSSYYKTIFGSEKNKIPVIRIRQSLAHQLADRTGEHVHIELPLVFSTITCQNVLGFLPGKNAEFTLALTAHYDHVGDDPNGLRFPGTIDNASGVAVMLEVARMLAEKEKLPFNIVIAFFTGEESGLWGARHWVSTSPLPLSAVINLDCLGYEPELMALRTGHNAPKDWLTALAVEVFTSHGIEVRWMEGMDDSIAFKEKGIPVLGLGQIPVLGENRNIHSTNDNPDNLHVRPLEQGVAVITDIIDRLVESPLPLGSK